MYVVKRDGRKEAIQLVNWGTQTKKEEKKKE